MHTSLLLFALMGPGAAPAAMAAPEAPSWQESYRAGRQVGRERRKPLAVFIGSGPAGWAKLTDEGGLTRKARQLLTASYVCVYVDLDSPEGKGLAGSLEIGSGTGLIISDRLCEQQAFWHQGTMSRGELEETLQKYTAVTTVRQTERLDRMRVASLSYDASQRPAANAPAYQPTYTTYAPASYVVPATYAAPAYYGGFGGYGGGFSGGFSRGGGC
jgi:hypothetical protein